MRSKFVIVSCLAAAGLGAAVGSFAVARGQENKGGAPEMKLPPGWTMDDMKACMDAGTPGEMHKFLTAHAGTWTGKVTQWMAPGAEPEYSDCTSTTTAIMDGRFTKCEVSSTMGGMPFNGFGIYGYDNVSKKFVASWIDSMGTGIMQGTGERSADGKTLTWNYTANCPIAKKAVPMREVDHFTSDKSFTMEMFGVEPKSGKEFKAMVIEFTRKN